MNCTFKKTERLCSQILIERLYKEGNSFLSYPLRFVFLRTELHNEERLQVLITASKKNFKRAVDRNLIKRRIREAYRLQKNTISDLNNLVVAINYIGKQHEEFSKIESQMIKGFEIIKKQLTDKEINQQ